VALTFSSSEYNIIKPDFGYIFTTGCIGCCSISWKLPGRPITFQEISSISRYQVL